MRLGGLSSGPNIGTSGRKRPRSSVGFFIFAEIFMSGGNKQGGVLVVIELLRHDMNLVEKLVLFGKNLIKLKRQLLV